MQHVHTLPAFEGHFLDCQIVISFTLNTGTFKQIRPFVPLSRHLTFNDFALKDSFEFDKIRYCFICRIVIYKCVL